MQDAQQDKNKLLAMQLQSIPLFCAAIGLNCELGLNVYTVTRQGSDKKMFWANVDNPLSPKFINFLFENFGIENANAGQ